MSWPLPVTGWRLLLGDAGAQRWDYLSAPGWLAASPRCAMRRTTASPRWAPNGARTPTPPPVADSR